MELAAAFRIAHHLGWNERLVNHITARVPNEPEHFLMNPHGVGWHEVTASNLAKADFNGKILSEGDVSLAPAGLNFHSGILKEKRDVNCVIHTHPEHAVAFSSLGKQLQPMSNDGTMFSAGVPIFSETTDLIINQERGKAVARALGDKGALILRNHGIVTAGSTIEHAVFLAIKLEKACRIQMLAEQAGGPKLFVKPEELAAKRGRTNRGDSQGNAFSYLVRRWHLRCNCEVPKEYRATLDNFDRSGYKKD